MHREKVYLAHGSGGGSPKLSDHIGLISCKGLDQSGFITRVAPTCSTLIKRRYQKEESYPVERSEVGVMLGHLVIPRKV